MIGNVYHLTRYVHTLQRGSPWIRRVSNLRDWCPKAHNYRKKAERLSTHQNPSILYQEIPMICIVTHALTGLGQNTPGGLNFLTSRLNEKNKRDRTFLFGSALPGVRYFKGRWISQQFCERYFQLFPWWISSYVCVCLHICGFTCVHTHAYGGLRLTSEVFLSSSLSYSLSQGLSLNLEIAD